MVKAFDSLERAIDEHGECQPDGVVTDTRDQWRDRYYTDTRAKEPKLADATLRQRFTRATAELLTARRIVTAGEQYGIACDIA